MLADSCFVWAKAEVLTQVPLAHSAIGVWTLVKLGLLPIIRLKTPLLVLLVWV